MAKNKSTEARALLSKYKELDALTGQAVFEKGKIASKLKSNDLFKAAFGETDKKYGWRSFLADPDGLDKPVATVEFQISIHEKWVKELGYSAKDLAPFHTRKLARAVPYATKENAEDILAKAATLSFSDFLIELTGKEPKSCMDGKHDPEHIEKCKVCKRILSHGD